MIDSAARFVVGIDLGTTHTCLSYIDTDRSKNPTLSSKLFFIPQLTSEGHVQSLPLLPSFYYLVQEGEFTKGALKLPWSEEKNYLVGSFAKVKGAQVPSAAVPSVKSWLSHASAARRDKILPLDPREGRARVSPIEVTTAYFLHLVEAWNHLMAKGRPEWELQQQDVVITVPASFDEVARLLTIEAARLAGFERPILLEEPQAAFYSWMMEQRGLVKEGDTILVCDVGGGTTDFSLIEVTGDHSFQRMAVGQHLLLGGDNMDLALAHFLEQKMDVSLSPIQWQQLVYEARRIKEELIEGAIDRASSVIQGRGSSVIGKGASCEVNYLEVRKLLMDGFFAYRSFEEMLGSMSRNALMTTGLPYEKEPSLPIHLARFLHSATDRKNKAPRFVLFNGGTLKPLLFRQALLEALRCWFPDQTIDELPASSFDFAVAKGASYYGKIRRGLGGIKIGGGSSCSYYLEVDVSGKKCALTLLPRGTEEGTEIESEKVFYARPNTPVSFHLFSSHTRLHDKAGDLIAIEEEQLQPLPLLQTILKFGKQNSQESLPVSLGMHLTAVGTLELWLSAKETAHRWNLAFQLRGGSDERVDTTLTDADLEGAKTFFRGLLEKGVEPKALFQELEEKLQEKREGWSWALLRAYADVLFQEKRWSALSPAHSARWWNALGFFLRPGYGCPLDDFRMQQLWKLILAQNQERLSQECLLQRWICFRRVAGGLSKGQQTQVAAELMSSVFEHLSKKGRRGSHAYVYSEQLRALASFERLDPRQKIKLGDALLSKIEKEGGSSVEYWALGRLGSRRLQYGGVGLAVPARDCERWLARLLQRPLWDEETEAIAFSQMAKKTSFRECSISDALAQQVLIRFHASPYFARLNQLLTQEEDWTPSETAKVFGDALPSGLELREGG